MSLVRWSDRPVLSPVGNLRDLENQFSRLFGELTPFIEGTQNWVPAVDVRETKDAYVIEADLPGMKKEDIEVTVQDNFVTIKGSRKYESDQKENGGHRVERRYGSFQRSFELPAGFQGDKIDASYRDGVLYVTLPKREETKPKQIDVRVN
ncbi:MAG: heat-shock protein [Candidatus Hydrogenedentota bacterium]